MMELPGGYRIREYQAGDQPGVLALLRSTFRSWGRLERPDEHFEWKHSNNPFGKSFKVVTEHEGAIVGFRASMPWEFWCNRRLMSAVRGADAAVATEHRRNGLWEAMMRFTFDRVDPPPDVAVHYGHAHTRAGSLKAGFSIIAPITKCIVPVRPVRLIRRRLSSGAIPCSQEIRRRLATRAVAARDFLSSPPVVAAVEALNVKQRNAGLVSTARGIDYLRWHYADMPGREYWAIPVTVRGGIRAVGMVRIQDHDGSLELELSEMMHRPGDSHVRWSLVTAAASLAPDYVTYLEFQARGGHRVTKKLGNVSRLGWGNVLLAKRLDAAGPIRVEPQRWSISLGDLDPSF